MDIFRNKMTVIDTSGMPWESKAVKCRPGGKVSHKEKNTRSI